MFSTCLIEGISPQNALMYKKRMPADLPGMQQKTALRHLFWLKMLTKMFLLLRCKFDVIRQVLQQNRGIHRSSLRFYTLFKGRTMVEQNIAFVLKRGPGRVISLKGQAFNGHFRGKGKLVFPPISVAYKGRSGQ